MALRKIAKKVQSGTHFFAKLRSAEGKNTREKWVPDGRGPKPTAQQLILCPQASGMRGQKNPVNPVNRACHACPVEFLPGETNPNNFLHSRVSLSLPFNRGEPSFSSLGSKRLLPFNIFKSTYNPHSLSRSRIFDCI